MTSHKLITLRWPCATWVEKKSNKFIQSNRNLDFDYSLYTVQMEIQFKCDIYPWLPNGDLKFNLQALLKVKFIFQMGTPIFYYGFKNGVKFCVRICTNDNVRG
ncbi:hypothetical protein HHI36_003490 [Cryptolaemus montrouzieri]|uniref:Uncharacterized protein n=1 Tax=Cryptolaemus montrouzieri TaxID=559131 RepID=A0ABD2PEA1_9CUCU